MTELVRTRKYRSESSKMEEHSTAHCRHLLPRKEMDEMNDTRSY